MRKIRGFGKNENRRSSLMGKLFDKIILSLLGAFVLFLVFFRFTGSIVYAAICSALSVGIVGTFIHVKKPKTPKGKLSKRDFVRSILLNGNESLKRIVENALRSDYTLSGANECTLIEINDKKAILCYAYKFGALSEEDVAKSYRIASRFGAETIYVFTNHTERKALAVTAYIPQRFVVIGAGTLYKYLLKKNLIPEKEKKQRKRKKAGFLLSSALTAKNAKYFVFAGFSTALIALLTPFAVYYIAFAFINLLLAALSLVFSEKGDGKNDLLS